MTHAIHRNSGADPELLGFVHIYTIDDDSWILRDSLKVGWAIAEFKSMFEQAKGCDDSLKTIHIEGASQSGLRH